MYLANVTFLKSDKSAAIPTTIVMSDNKWLEVPRWAMNVHRSNEYTKPLLLVVKNLTFYLILNTTIYFAIHKCFTPLLRST